MSQRAVTRGLNSKLDFVACRWWDETGSSPTAAGYYGSLEALRSLPEKLGLGRYLVTDDRVRRKLDPQDSTRFEDGSPAALDGSMGQCMWCWNAHYYTTWKEGAKTFEAISFAPILGKDSRYVPAGGTSWFGAGVLDRQTTTLCSLISDEERYRGGLGEEIDINEYTVPPGVPQQTMLGMPRTSYSCNNFGTAARRRGEGWEANWFVAQAVTEYVPRIILGTRSIQQDFNPELDENGLMRGGMGPGMTTWVNSEWSAYNRYCPLLPTSFGLETGDATTVLNHSIYDRDGEVIRTFEVPVFFGLVNAGYGNLYKAVRGLVLDNTEEFPKAYVAQSMFSDFDSTAVGDMLYSRTFANETGYVREIDMTNLASLPIDVSGNSIAYYGDRYTVFASASGLVGRLAGGIASSSTYAGSLFFSLGSITGTWAYTSAPLCYFEEDPIIG